MVIPLFLAASTMQHAIDLQNFLPADQPATSTPAFPGAEVLEEISTEDDIHSLLLFFSQPKFLLSNPDFLLSEVNVLNKIVPTPPPDLA